MDEKNCNTMNNQFDYELINIEWSLNYEPTVANLEFYVSEDKSIPDSAGAEKPTIEYDANGIPMGTSKEEVKIRQQIIYDFYQRWKAEHPEKSIYNKSLQADIFIRNESVVEAAFHASKRYKSTLAVLNLDEVLANAKEVDTDKPKVGNKNQQKLIRMILMSYYYPEIGTIKLTVGVRNRSFDKIQYGITAVNETDKTEPMVDEKTKKTPHKK